MLPPSGRYSDVVVAAGQCFSTLFFRERLILLFFIVPEKVAAEITYRRIPSEPRHRSVAIAAGHPGGHGATPVWPGLFLVIHLRSAWAGVRCSWQRSHPATYGMLYFLL